MLLKKGQLGLIETIIILIVFFIIIIIAIVFYYKFYFSDIERTGEEISLQRADVLLASITSLAEVQCSSNLIDEECIDAGKLMILNSSLSLNGLFRSNYFDSFQYKVIKFKQVYPNGVTFGSPPINCETDEFKASKDTDNNCLWTIYDNSKLNYKSKISVSTPVSLYYPGNEVYTIGKLIVEVYR